MSGATTAGHWALVSGYASGVIGLPLDRNPYTGKRGGAKLSNGERRLALLWRVGHAGAGVKRETVSSPGRGRGAAGPRREWTSDEIAALVGGHDVRDADLAYALGRTAVAVRVKRLRLKSEAA